MEDRIKKTFNNIYAEKDLKENTKQYLNNQISKRSNSQYRFRKYIVINLCVLSAFIGIFIFGRSSYTTYSQATSYIDIDVNPSVELSVNKFDIVVQADAYNADGKLLLANVNIKNKSYSNATEILFNQMKDMGYIEGDGKLSITVQTNDEKKQEQMIGILKNMIEPIILGNEASNELSIFPVTSEVKSSSHMHHITPAKYIAITNLQKVDSTATINGCRNHSISELEEMTHGHGMGHGHNIIEESTGELGESSMGGHCHGRH